MLELHGLRAGYGQRNVLENIELSFLPGQVTGIIGPNGCGKSTLLRTAAGLHPASGGQVLLNGTPLSSLTTRQRAQQVAYLPQGRNVPDITALRMVLHGRFAYLSYPRHYRKEDYQMACTALEWVGASQLAKRSMPTLSGGQRQKIYLAMALAQDTQVVLMDEPTTYLDIQARFEVMSLAQRLADMGKAVGMVLHDLDLVLRYAHRVVVMDNGRVAADGTPAEVCAGDRLGQVFQVSIHPVDTPDGTWHCFTPRAPDVPADQASSPAGFPRSRN